MRFEDIYERHRGKRLSAGEAAEWLGVSERTFRRWRGRYAADGAAGLLDRRLGKISPHRVPADEVARIAALYEQRYTGWTVKHFHERARDQHGLNRSYGWTKSVLQARGLVAKAPKRSAHRKKRPRRPVPGMLLHQDGSRHAWVPGLGHQLDLIATLDDATSEVYSLFLLAEEGTASTFQALAEVIAARGLFSVLYTDRGSHYFHTPKAGGKVAKDTPTQVGRALAQLGIQHVPIPRRRAGAQSGCSARCRAGCPGSWRMRASPPWRRPTATSPRPTCPRTTGASRWPPSRTARRSCPGAAGRWRRCCAIRRTGWWRTTTP